MSGKGRLWSGLSMASKMSAEGTPVVSPAALMVSFSRPL